jgi:hypothetical protein
MIAQHWAAIRDDIRIWPGAKPIDADYEWHAFAPNSLHVLLNEFGERPRIVKLLLRATTPQWSRRDADALIDAISDELAAAVEETGCAAYDEHARAEQKKDDAVRQRAATNRSRKNKLRDRIIAIDAVTPRDRKARYMHIAREADASEPYVREVLAGTRD